MKQFSKILVGVDLSAGDKMVGEQLPRPTNEAIERALWLAELNAASVTFFYALDIGEQAQRLIEEDSDAAATVVGKAEKMLDKQVARAKKVGVTADHQVTFGKSWLTITRQVLQNDYDLVVVGGKQHGAVDQLLIGSTGMKLLRKCPCPVWVTHLPNKKKLDAILVGHDLTEVGQQALQLGAEMAARHEATLHVVHAVEPLYTDMMEPLAALADVSEEALSTSEDTIREQLRQHDPSVAAEVHVVSGSPSAVLQETIDSYEIDLLVMGTVARSGIQGLIFGNTAERLLPQIKCSVLAVKPADFVSPIQPE